MLLASVLAVGCSGADFSASAGSGGDAGFPGLSAGTSSVGDGGRSSSAGATSASGGSGGLGASGASSGGTGEAGAREAGGTSGSAGTSEAGAAGEPSSGGSSGDGGSTGNGGSNSGSGGTLSTAGTAGAGGGGAGNGGAGGGCTAVPWFPDADGDGFGRSSGQVVACSAPASGIWVTKGGDCNDDNKAVFPKEPDFKADGYTSSGNAASFDYDCSGAEEVDPTSKGAAPDCSLLGCSGSGFQPTARTGPGVNPLCGSKSLVTCTSGTLSCAAVVTLVSDGVRCR